MAHKKRLVNGDFNIELSHSDMLRVEKLLRILDNVADDFLTRETNEWLSNAQVLFAPELPPGEYPI